MSNDAVSTRPRAPSEVAKGSVPKRRRVPRAVQREEAEMEERQDCAVPGVPASATAPLPAGMAAREDNRRYWEDEGRRIEAHQDHGGNRKAGKRVQGEVTDYRAGKRCYNYKGVHIPGCWGCVIRGHGACTCRSPKQEDVIAKMNMLERRVAELESL